MSTNSSTRTGTSLPPPLLPVTDTRPSTTAATMDDKTQRLASPLPAAANKSSSHHKASTAAAVTVTPPAAKTTTTQGEVCRFLVSDLKNGASLMSTTDHHIDLNRDRHGLFDLVTKVFDLLNEKGLSDDRPYSHLWSLTFQGKRFTYGWNEPQNRGRQGFLDETSPGVFDALKTGDKGTFRGESASFSFQVVATNLQVDGPLSLLEDPTVTAVPPKAVAGSSSSSSTTLSNKLEADFVSADLCTQCQALQTGWKAWFAGRNEWRRDRKSPTYAYMLQKPVRPDWRPDEDGLLVQLLQAGCKFKKSWTHVLQYAFVDRTEPGTSARWYMLAKNPWRWGTSKQGAGNADPEALRHAKRMAQTLMMAHLDRGLPDPPSSQPPKRLRLY